MDILLTNDDGIDSTGLAVLHDALSEVGDVLVVAPTEDQSATGRALSDRVRVEDHDLGYAVGGTPVDCVVAGLEELGPYPDLVVAGCNAGANLGAYVLGRSGTVSAAVEAAFFDVPAIAASLYLPPSEDFPAEPPPEDYRDAVRATRYLAERSLEAGVFEHVDYLNVNARPAGESPASMTITRPSHAHHMDAVAEGDGTITLHDRIWDRIRDGSLEDLPGTDRHAVRNGFVSVTPLCAPHTSEQIDALADLAEAYGAG